MTRWISLDVWSRSALQDSPLAGFAFVCVVYFSSSHFTHFWTPTMIGWFRNLFTAIGTVLNGMGVTFHTFISTFNPDRRTFTEHFEYPELPAPVAARYRGFHRYDLTTCIACDQCAKACPVDCIYIGKEKATGKRIDRGRKNKSQA